MTEVIITVDSRKEVESLRQHLKNLKDDLAQDSNKQIGNLLECFKQESKELLKQV